MTSTRPPLQLQAHPQRQSAQLHDLWQTEEQVAWRIDAWLIKCLRSFPNIDAELVGTVRRHHHRSRQALRQRIMQLGRAVVRIPFVAGDDGVFDLSTAARELQSVHHELIRARDRTEAALFIAHRDRDFATVNVLKGLQESHLHLIALVRSIFQEGQRMSREQVQVDVA